MEHPSDRSAILARLIFILAVPASAAGSKYWNVEDTSYWGYPDSAVFVKQFDIDTVPGDTTSRRFRETRLLINKKQIVDSATRATADFWYGFTCKWNERRTDAAWVGGEDRNDSIRVAGPPAVPRHRAGKLRSGQVHDAAARHL